MARTHSATAEGLRQYAEQFEKECSKYAVWQLNYVQGQLRGCGTVGVTVAAQNTVPNLGKVTYAGALKKNSPGIVNLRKHISEDIGGDPFGDDPKNYAHGVPIRLKDGRWDYRPTSPWGIAEKGHTPPSGLVVPVKRPRGFRSAHVDMAWLKSNTELRPARSGGREVRVRKTNGVTFAPEATIKRLIKAEQKQAGKLLSGWAPAAAAFKHGRAPGGLYPQLGGKGSVKLVVQNTFKEYAWKIVNSEFPNDRSDPMSRTSVQLQISKICASRMSKALKNAQKHKIAP